jgi:hypothetical protein
MTIAERGMIDLFGQNVPDHNCESQLSQVPKVVDTVNGNGKSDVADGVDGAGDSSGCGARQKSARILAHPDYKRCALA